jgi:hypothetical protein
MLGHRLTRIAGVGDGVTASEVPPRRTEARRIAEAVVEVLEDGAAAASEDLSWPSSELCRQRVRTVYRGLAELGVGDVTVTVRQLPDLRWRWYARRRAEPPPS